MVDNILNNNNNNNNNNKYMLIHVQVANKKHCDMILNWRNNIETRKASSNSKEIPLEAHKKWYNNFILKNNYNMFICKQLNSFIGVVRFDQISNFSYNISINLNPDFRGKKLSSVCFKQALEKFTMHNKWKYLYANIKPNNISSIKCFEKNKFFLKEKIKIYGVDHLQFCLDSKTLIHHL